jgi:hypothetical protein
MTAAVLAHQGGWDEILMVLVPIGIFAVLLAVANRRADAIGGQRRRDDTDKDGDADADADPDTDAHDRGNPRDTRRDARRDVPREGPPPR